MVLLETFDYQDELYIDWPLFILKICMVLETLKRIYFYSSGFFFIYYVLCLQAVEPGYIEEKIELTYTVLWGNFYSHYKYFCGFGPCISMIIIIFTLAHGVLAMLSPNIIGVVIAFGVLNVIYIILLLYSMCWICKTKSEASRSRDRYYY